MRKRASKPGGLTGEPEEIVAAVGKFIEDHAASASTLMQPAEDANAQCDAKNIIINPYTADTISTSQPVGRPERSLQGSAE